MLFCRLYGKRSARIVRWQILHWPTLITCHLRLPVEQRGVAEDPGPGHLAVFGPQIDADEAPAEPEGTATTKRLATTVSKVYRRLKLSDSDELENIFKRVLMRVRKPLSPEWHSCSNCPRWQKIAVNCYEETSDNPTEIVCASCLLLEKSGNCQRF